ncbi:MAG: hypothetical protein HYX41_01555 [Bdellovibrio sp.]|nr:hypothetical protein [Bdellovibrio sp.]
MARKYNLVKRLKDPFVIQVDSGDTLFPTQIVPELLKAQSEVQAAYVIQAMNLTRQDVAVPGEKDFALGFKVFERLRKKAKFKYLASNLTLKNGNPFLPGHVILEGKEEGGKTVKVGIFGIVDEGLKWPAELKADSSINAAKKEVAFLRSKVDYLIAVTHQGIPKDEKMVKAAPGIDIVVAAHSQTFMQDPHRLEKTILVESSFRNQYVGVFSLKKPIDIKKYNLEGLDAGYDSPQGSPSEMDQLILDFKGAIAKINSERELSLLDEQEKKAAASGEKITHFHTFPKCAQCHLVQFDFWRKTRHSQALEPLLEKKQVKNKECLQCHSVGIGHKDGYSDVNQLSLVSQAAKEEDSGPRVQTLDGEQLAFVLREFKGASSLKSKIKLHEKDSEKVPLRDSLAMMTYAWAPVQCENCHRAGRGHPFSGRYTKSVAQETCLQCHTFDRAPNWYKPSGEPNLELIAEKRKMITCPAGDINPESD